MYKSIFTFSAKAALFAATFFIVYQAKAGTVFPPPHLAQGASVARGEARPGRSPGTPWYFSAQAHLEANLDEALRQAPAVATTVGPRAWYRAAD